MAEGLFLISRISFIGAGICLVLAVFLWFRLGIPAVFGELSGRTARKSIAKMRENNKRSGKQLRLLDEVVLIHTDEVIGL